MTLNFLLIIAAMVVIVFMLKRTMVAGLVLWLFISITSLLAIRFLNLMP